MAQRKSTSEGQPGAAPATTTPPPWMHRPASYPPDRRAKMLEHMARARSVPQPQATASPVPARKNGLDILGDLFGYTVLFSVIAILCASRIPLYLGAFLFLADDERIESAFAAVGVQFKPNAVGPELIKGFASWFGWIALLASLRASAPAWLAPSCHRRSLGLSSPASRLRSPLSKRSERSQCGVQGCGSDGRSGSTA